MIKFGFRVALTLVVFAAALQGQRREALLRYVSATPNWKAVGTPLQYDETSSGALGAGIARELKLYGLTGVTVQSWQGPQGQARSTLFEMSDPSAAYGFFTLRRSTENIAPSPRTIGTENFQVGSQFYFWQSNYVVKIEGGTEATSALAQIVSENIIGRSEKPTVATLLPPENLVKESETYILNPDNIDRKFGVDPGKLGFEDSAEAATASYRVAGKSIRLLLVLYPTQQIAKKYADRLDVDPASSATASTRKRSALLLAIVGGTTDLPVIQSVLDKVHYESKVTWNEPRPDANIADVILTIFKFTGLALLFTIVVGVGFGGLRVLVKSRYPNRVFDRPQAMEIIQLKIDQGLTRKELNE